MLKILRNRTPYIDRIKVFNIDEVGMVDLYVGRGISSFAHTDVQQYKLICKKIIIFFI